MRYAGMRRRRRKTKGKKNKEWKDYKPPRVNIPKYVIVKIDEGGAVNVELRIINCCFRLLDLIEKRASFVYD